MNKAAILFMLNRVTGEPIYPVTETPVPASRTFQAKQAWPTQPDPSHAAATDPQRLFA